MIQKSFNRRAFLRATGAGIAAAALTPLTALAKEVAKGSEVITKKIRSSGETVPIIGMGTWRTFNVGESRELREDRTDVLAAFFLDGGALIDSSPMYGSSQDVIGYGLEKLGMPDVFAADKVWTNDASDTRDHIAASRRDWRIDRFDLMQVHNLLAWQGHLPTLHEMKEAGEIRYVGVTTSHGRRHDELERLMKTERLDFVQLTYNMVDREVERRLLPLAADRGIAVIANRPFRGGALVDTMQGGNHPLPEWASEIDCDNWPQFFLKFIVSHPGVTCAIPATTRVEHVRENMGAARGRLPDMRMRRQMVQYLSSL